MLGQCFQYVVKSEKGRRVIPLKDKQRFFGRSGYNFDDYGYGTVYSQAGISFSYDYENNRTLFGAPGSWDWSGTLVVGDEDGNNPIMTQPWSPMTPVKYDYTAYSATSGHYLGTRQRQYAVGAPRAGRKRPGMVYVVQFYGSENIDQVFLLKGNLCTTSKF